MIFTELLFGRSPRQITREELDLTVARLKEGTLAEAERCLGITQPFRSHGRRTHFRVLSSEERARRRRRVDRFLGLA